MRTLRILASTLSAVIMLAGASPRRPRASRVADELYATCQMTAPVNPGRVKPIVVAMLLASASALFAGALPAAAGEASGGGTVITGSFPDDHVGSYVVPLDDGDALILAGGEQDGSWVDISFRFDARVGEIEPSGDLLEARAAPGVTLLRDGSVLVTGGLDTDGRALASAELWRAETDEFVTTGSLREARAAHSSTVLPDGRVLVIGGLDAFADGMESLASAEIWDPESAGFVEAGALAQARYGHTATALADGRVLVVGGVSITSGVPSLVDAIELWDPDDGDFSTVGTFPRDAVNHTATLLPDGRALIVGGVTGGGAEVSDALEVWDPASGSVASAGTLRGPRALHAASLLDDGSVAIIGGRSLEGPLARVEIWREATGVEDSGIDLLEPRSTPSVATLSDGRVLVVGGFGSGEYLSTYELWSLAIDGDTSGGSDTVGG